MPASSRAHGLRFEATARLPRRRPRAGYGVALLPRYLAAKDSGLVKVLPGQLLPERDVWLLVRRELSKVPRIRAVADYLFAAFARERRLLGGGR